MAGLIAPQPDDSTPTREARRRERDRRQLLGAILDAAPDPVVAIDCEGRLRYANPACETLFGGASEEALGRRVTDAIRSHEPEASDAGDRVRRGHAELRLPSGDTRWVAYSSSRMELPDGGRISVVFLRDETDRRRDDLRLSRHNDELEQTIRSLAHDLRSPLVSVLGFSRLLREDFGAVLGDKGTHFLERITSAGRSMESLIRDLLDFARIGHEVERPALVDPREVLHQLKGEFKPRLEQQAVELALPDDPPLVRCDRTRMYQLFSNLVGNALDHMGPRHGARITVAIREHADRHELIVSDNGRGVPVEERERIFEMFHSVQQPGGRKGTGIGLAIVRKIAERHGGRAWVESGSKRGASFHVVLPRS